MLKVVTKFVVYFRALLPVQPLPLRYPTVPFAFAITLRTAYLLLCPMVQIELSAEDARQWYYRLRKIAGILLKDTRNTLQKALNSTSNAL